MTTSTRTSVSRRSLLKVPLALAGVATVANLAAFRAEVAAADDATLRELVCDVLRNCESEIGPEYLINAHRAVTVAGEASARLQATFSPEQHSLFWTHREAEDEADSNVRVEQLFRFVDALAKHFPEQAQAIRIVGAHLWRVEYREQACEAMLPPWAPYRWDECMGLVPLEEPEADAAS
jgi:hypothetical protein